MVVIRNGYVYHKHGVPVYSILVIVYYYCGIMYYNLVKLFMVIETTVIKYFILYDGMRDLARARFVLVFDLGPTHTPTTKKEDG